MKSKIYLIRYDGLGDSLWLEPIFEHLAGQCKKLVVVTHHPYLFENHPLKNIYFQNRLSLIEKVLFYFDKYVLRSGKFLNLNGSYEQKPKMHFLKAYLSDCGLNVKIQYPKLFLSKDEKQKKWRLQKYVVLHLDNSSGKNYRKIYGVNWVNIASFLKQKGIEVIQIGNTNQQITNTFFQQTDNPRHLISLISGASFFIGGDSGPSHIAAALGVPSLIFFGSVNPEFRHIMELFKGLILQQKCEYAGCYHETIGFYGQTCRIVGNDGVPPCCLHSDSYVIEKIEQLIYNYNI